jgi:glycyl-radical enzyme activating protein
MSGMVGRVFDIQRFSTHDGPGIRTTVFLKGCPLDCLWCHNPEGIDPRPDLAFSVEKCGGCGECVRVCRNHAHTVHTADGAVTHTLDRERCEACGECAAVCDSGCVELVGRSLTVEEVMREVLADRPFYRRTFGGLTVSGGEPLVQVDFLAALLEAARAEGIHCAVETCGFVKWESLRRVLPLVDLFLYDYKVSDPRAHAELTGQSNALILDNLRRLYDAGARISLQCPLIPGCNDTAGHLAGIAALAASMPSLEGVRILPYHPLGADKLARFGRTPRATVPADDARRTAEAWSRHLEALGIRTVPTP